MDFKEEYKNTIERVKTLAMTKGQRLTNADIAQSVGMERETLQNLLSPRGKVLKKHLDVLKLTYHDLLQNTTVGSTKNPDNIDYRDILVESQRDQLESYKDQIKLLKEKLEVNLAGMRRTQRVAAAMVRIALENQADILAALKKVDRSKIQSENNKAIDALLKNNEQMDTF